MTKVHSAGVILYRYASDESLEVFLAHPGGPFWKNKDEASWSIPKGIAEDEETELVNVARREFAEETGFELHVDLKYIGDFKQPSGKIIFVWTGSQDIDANSIHSNFFEMEWPPKSGNKQSFPEIDRAQWFDLSTARIKVLKGQLPIIEKLIEVIDYSESVSDGPKGEQFGLF